MNRVSYHPGKFLFQFDAFAGAVGNDVKFKLNDKTVVKADVRSILFRLMAGYSILDKFSHSQKVRYDLTAYTGARFHLFHMDMQLGNTPIGFDIDPYWSEVILGL